MKTLGEHLDNPKVQEEGLWAAGNLSAGNDTLKNRLFELGILDAVVLSLRVSVAGTTSI